MFRVVFIFLLLVIPTFSQTIHFSEEKYYDALEKRFNKEGKIIFDNGKIQIVYDDSTTVTYTGDFLYTQKDGKMKKLDLSKKPAVKMFFLLFEAIYFNKREVLNSYFTSQKLKDIMILTPKENISRYINIVQYQKIKNRLNFLEIKLTNKDWVRIEELD
ncbi:MAG: hypothetical protein DRG78_10390 [Epsilonproteobacteria bacterium]|nr:MAG: hypothetical protein DRG78_10390 [Campylobacterota bacterium]